VGDSGVQAPLARHRRVPNPKNRVDNAVESTVDDYAIEEPAHGQVRVSNELRKRSIFVSPSGVRSIWLLNDLANVKQRLKTLEVKVADEGVVLTEPQVQALERKKLDVEACGEIETTYTGIFARRTRFMRQIQGRFQDLHNSVDSYAKVAHCKSCATTTPISAADPVKRSCIAVLRGSGISCLSHDYQLILR
jgi:hypothetical protein